MSFLAEFGKAFIPKRIRPNLRSYLEKAGIINQQYEYFGMIFFVSMILTFIIFFFGIYPSMLEWSLFAQFIVIFLGIAAIAFAIIGFFSLIAYFYLDLRIYHRTMEIERILPEYLAIVSSNVKSGISVEKSLWFAIKPRFGILAYEMETVLKKVLTGHELSDALTEFSQKYDSPMLRRAMFLIIGEIDSGGSISKVLDGVVHNLKMNQKLKAELSASVITYVIFIGAIVIVIAPGLFALSYNLLTFLKTFVVTLEASGASSANSMFSNINSESIDLNSFGFFSIGAVLLVALFSSMIVSIIEKGNIRGGVKYIPIFVVGSLIAYFIFMAVLRAIFGNFF